MFCVVDKMGKIYYATKYWCKGGYLENVPKPYFVVWLE